MKLVAAKEHLFCRWDDGKERFNIEGAGNGGVDDPPGEYYRTWPKPLTNADMATGVFLTSMSPEAELADFLHHRGMCLHQNGRLTEARAAFAEAHRLQHRDANTFTALRVVCGAVPRPRYAQNPAAEAWRYGPRPADPSDPTAQIYQQMMGPSVGTYGNPVQPGIPTQHQPGMPDCSGHPGVLGPNGSRSCLGCPGWRPIFRRLLRCFPLEAGGLGGLTMSLDGGLDEFEEFLESRATCSAS